MKRTILRCAAGLLIAAALLPTALAAEPFPAVTEVQVCKNRGILEKTYNFAPNNQ